MSLRIILFAFSIFWCLPSSLLAQQKTVDLFRLAQTGGLVVQNRMVTSLTEGSRKGIRMSAAQGDGMAWIKGFSFSNGSIELDIRGKDVLQQSFVGFAFHAINKDSLESVYVTKNTIPSLTVKELSSLKGGRIGLWVGNNSDGDFANLVIASH